jgi:pimeloyl-ACP methyl ester carboxylesterase
MRVARVSTICALISTLVSSTAAGQAIDNLVDVGGYRLHFHIVPGHGIPILFESGGGNDATVWQDLLQPVAAATGTTLITYDRAGWGRSEIDTTRHGILNGVESLEAGLRKLGYADDIILVAHSFGGFYATLYASRHPQHIKAAILIDANLACFFTEDELRRLKNSNADLKKPGGQSVARDFEAIDWDSTVAVMRRTPFPSQIPVLDIIAERTLFEGTPNAERWRACHREFVAASAARQGITARGSGHYVFRSSPELVTVGIARSYADFASQERRSEALARVVDYALEAVIDVKARADQYRHSEDDLNSWGYDLLGRNAKQQALAVFQLNASLHPQSATAYDSLAEGYEAAGDREQAIRNYKRALEISPGYKHSAERLRAMGAPQRQ